MLGDFENKAGAVVEELEGVQDGRKVVLLKLDVDDGTNNLTNLAGGDGLGSSLSGVLADYIKKIGESNRC
ncbi:hypothetical protein LPJ66_011018 [Kickxella alabastrina]|uniref:Uncharacterized protein n=1 Tax=Kickxella alabastrina TaxID=61397 RepID=A0ACC1HZ20_9FUNG|nr:hypothetical protein LPJ66_011018 [Kickxella alabastrina]